MCRPGCPGLQFVLDEELGERKEHIRQATRPIGDIIAPVSTVPARLPYGGDGRNALYLLDEQDLIVGVSGYAVRPPQVRREKPRVSAFTSADIPKILALEPVQLYTLPPRFIFVRWQPQRLLASMGQPPSVGHTAMQQCLHIPRRL